MKVLLVNTSDNAGGAAIAALRLLKALRSNGVEASLLCRDRTLPTKRQEVIGIKSSWLNKLRFLLERLEIFIHNGCTRKGLFAVDTARFGNDITHLDEFRKADVIHLHWTNQAMLSLKDLKAILHSEKKVVWTMHDMWPFTGICHQADTCKLWQEGCGNCPQLQRPGNNDLSARTFKRKKLTYPEGEITFVACSQWLAGLAGQAPLLQGQKVWSIPNPIDTDFYAPAGTEGMPTRSEVRHRLGLPQDKRLMLFTAFKVTDPNKGIDYLIESITILLQEHPELREQTALVLAGKESEQLTESFPIPVYSMGYISETKKMRDLYLSADLLLMPTLMDNLPNTIVEAMACGIPSVAFNIGGVPEMVDTGINGYLAKYKDSLDFATGIARILLSQSYTAIGRNARSKAVKVYSEQRIAQCYQQVYEGQAPR